MPKLSVLMPTRNAEIFVERAVVSTLSALPDDSELVVLNDASTDSTAECLEKIRDPKLRVLSVDEAHGVAGGLNALIEATDSELVARMDSDDVCLPWRFRLQLRDVDRADVSFTSAIRVSSRGHLIRRASPPIPISPRAMGLTLMLGNPLYHPTMIARRSTLDRLGGYRNVHSEDYDLWLRACAAGYRLRQSAVPSILYRVHAAQISSDAGWREKAYGDELADSYRRLVSARLGLELDVRAHSSWIDAPLVSSLSRSSTQDFTVRFRRAIRELPLTERAALGYRLSRRLPQDTQS